MRDLLIAHIDGPTPFVAKDSVSATRRSALRRGWLRAEHRAARNPRETVLTDRGRAVLAAALGEWADAIARAGFRRGGEVEKNLEGGHGQGAREGI